MAWFNISLIACHRNALLKGAEGKEPYFLLRLDTQQLEAAFWCGAGNNADLSDASEPTKLVVSAIKADTTSFMATKTLRKTDGNHFLWVCHYECQCLLAPAAICHDVHISLGLIIQMVEAIVLRCCCAFLVWLRMSFGEPAESCSGATQPARGWRCRGEIWGPGSCSSSATRSGLQVICSLSRFDLMCCWASTGKQSWSWRLHHVTKSKLIG